MDLLRWITLLTVLTEVSGSGFDVQNVQIDLQLGFVRGYSKYITFVKHPSSGNGRCDSQAVIKIDFSGPYKGAELVMHYGKSPRLWTLDISDSRTGDGYGGDDGTTSNMAEVQIHNRQMRIYGNMLPGYMDATSDGGLLIRTIDGFVTKGSKAVLTLSDERVEWTRGKIKDFLQSKFLFTLNGQEPTHGDVDYDVYIGFNRVVAGNFRNGSGLCSVNIKLISYPGNECAKGTLKCSENAECVDYVRNSKCRCKKGFSAERDECVDNDECVYKNGGCSHFCKNSQGNYTCECRSGFELDLDRRNCIDRNECLNNKGGCMQQCVNTVGGFDCKCNKGYSMNEDGKSCKLGNWCQKSQGCEQFCKTTAQGAVVCTCLEGYRLHPNGKNCVKTCRVGNGGCQHTCTDTIDGVKCSCAVDYKLLSDGQTCTATCKVNNGGCSRKCNDTADGPVICSCPYGYQLHQDQKSCLDIDQCATKNGGCSHGCVNLEGGYECTCPPGHKVKSDQLTCEDIDECEVKSTCDHVCVNTQGSYICACKTGYDKYGISHCADKDECSSNNGECEQVCENSVGSYRCLCNQGYKLHKNGRDCIPDNECYELNSPPGGKLRCDTQGSDNVCVVKCARKERFVEGVNNTFTTKCGPTTTYQWEHDLKNVTLPACSSHVQSPSLTKKVVMRFISKQCKRREMLRLQLSRSITATLNGDKKFKCDKQCNVVEPVKMSCKRERKSKKKGKSYMVTMEFYLTYKSPPKLKKGCDVKCIMKKRERKLKKVIKKLRRAVKKSEFNFTYSGNPYTAYKKTFKSPRGYRVQCSDGSVMVDNVCVGCSKGSFYDSKDKVCRLCPPSYYQDEEAQMKCKSCQSNPLNFGIHGATSKEECTVQCEPGQYSSNGRKPCKPCLVGTYQTEYGRLSCRACGGGMTTNTEGAVDFKSCTAKELCNAGHFYDTSQHACIACKRGSYQPRAGQNYCIKCPAETTTDNIASKDITQCKSHKCGGIFKKNVQQGVIESPNYPGDFPTNVSCIWKIRPHKNRRILVIIPEIDLPKSDKCGDRLVMRKSKNEFSTVTYETCETSGRPIAFTAMSKKLWIQFRSDGANTAKGFSIPFVTYNAEYKRLIEDIVKDGTLYSSFQHQSVLKNRKVLNALMEVIAQPTRYFKYANVTKTVIPPSFLRLLKRKVIRFLNP